MRLLGIDRCSRVACAGRFGERWQGPGKRPPGDLSPDSPMRSG